MSCAAVRTSGIGFLERASVSEQVLQRYGDHVTELKLHAGPPDLVKRSDEAVDSAMVAYMEELFTQGASANHGSYLLAGFQALYPEFGKYGSRKLPRVHRALAGWRKERPAFSRAPHAFPVLAGLAVLSAQRHSVLMAKQILLAFGAYARPSELRSMRGVDFVPPLAGVKYWSLLIRPQELVLPTKTGEFDDSVVWDVAALEFLTKDFARWHAEGRKEIFPITYAELLKTVHAAAKEMGVEGLTPYAMRHAGASHDAIHKLRTLAEIQKRGRWRCHRSVTRYEKGGRVGASYARLSLKTRVWMERCVANLEKWINEPRLAAPLR